MGKAEKLIGYTAMGAVLFIAGMAWQDVEQLEDFHTFLHELGHWIVAGGGIIHGNAFLSGSDSPIISIGSLLGLQLFAAILAHVGGWHFPPLAFFGVGWSLRTTADVFAFPDGQFGGDQIQYTAVWYPVAIACSAMVIFAMIYGMRRKPIIGFARFWAFWSKEFRAYKIRTEGKYGHVGRAPGGRRKG